MAPKVARPPRCRLFCFTRNKRDDELALPAPYATLPEGATWLCFQAEKGAAGRPHYQGAIYFSTAKTLAAAVVALGSGGVHVEAAKGKPSQQRRYCTKCCGSCFDAGAAGHGVQDDCDKCDRVQGPWNLGTEPQQGKRTDIDQFVAVVRKRGYEEAAIQHPAPFVKYHTGAKQLDFIYRKRARMNLGFVSPTIWVLFGAPNTGKSRWAFSSTDGGIYCKEDLDDKWWDGYNGENRVVFDDFYGQIRYHRLLTILDGHAATRKIQTKGGFSLLSNSEFVFTSNSSPLDWYANVADKNALYSRLFHRSTSMIYNVGTKRQIHCPGCTDALCLRRANAFVFAPPRHID